MTIFTPRGLKIRVDTDEAFSLLAAIHPEVHPKFALECVEGLELYPRLAAATAAIATCMLGLSVWVAVATIGIVRLVAFFLSATGLLLVPGMVSIGRLYSKISGFGLLVFIVGGAGFVADSWRGALLYVLGLYGSGAATLAIDVLVFVPIRRRLLGGLLYTSEINFFTIVSMFSASIGRTPDLDELICQGEDKKAEVFSAYASTCPEAATRTTQITGAERSGIRFVDS